jgi:hypothetical protein
VIAIHSQGEYFGAPLDLHNTTTIVVEPRHS